MGATEAGGGGRRKKDRQRGRRGHTTWHSNKIHVQFTLLPIEIDMYKSDCTTGIMTLVVVPGFSSMRTNK
jgi:hypothetical protein